MRLAQQANSALQLLCGSSTNDLVSFGINDRSDAEALAAAVDGVADVEKWLELQVIALEPCSQLQSYRLTCLQIVFMGSPFCDSINTAISHARVHSLDRVPPCLTLHSSCLHDHKTMIT